MIPSEIKIDINDTIRRSEECIVFDCSNDITKGNVGCECMSMINHGFFLWTIPTIHYILTVSNGVKKREETFSWTIFRRNKAYIQHNDNPPAKPLHRLLEKTFQTTDLLPNICFQSKISFFKKQSKQGDKKIWNPKKYVLWEEAIQ
jgi:hypothetical protein